MRIEGVVEVAAFFQVKVALSQQTAPTLINLQTALKQPADAQEQQLLIDYSQNRFQASPTTPLTQAQLYRFQQYMAASVLPLFPDKPLEYP